MLRELIVKVKAMEDGLLPFFNGTYIHGLFFKMINERDNEYSQILHNRDEQKPFTISNIYSKNATERHYIITRNQVYSFRLTFIDDETYGIYVGAILKYQTNGTIFNIGQVRFIIDGFQVRNQLSLEEIVEDDIAYTRNFEISYLSPTAFKRNGKNHLIPEPYSIFKSLSNRWNKYLDTDVIISEDEFIEIERSIYITKYKLETEMIELEKYKMIGFKGKCTYEFAKDIDMEILKKINYLLKFAPYCGVGYKTTMGMGQVGIRGN